MSDTNKVPCRTCRELIHEKAKTCHWCGARQHLGTDFLLGTLPPIVSILVIVVLVWQIVIARDQNRIAQKQTDIAQEQVEETKRKRVEAEKVLDEAREVKQKAEGLLSDAETVKVQAAAQLESVRQQTEDLQNALKELDKELDDTSRQVSSSLDVFEKRQKDLSDEVVALKDELSAENRILKRRNDLMGLSDKAIAGGDAKAFEDLLKKEKAAEKDTPDHLLIASELLRVKSFYLLADRGKNARIGRYDSEGNKNYDVRMETSELIGVLKRNEHWSVRKKAATLLGDRKEKGVPDALVDGLKDSILDVRRSCIVSFERLFRDFNNPDVLDGAKMIEWWEKNKDAKLPELQ